MPAPRNRVESMLGIRVPRRSMPAARRPAPERAPTPPRPAPERRVERVAEKAQPAKRAETNTIKAIVIDPARRTVSETRIATEPGDERGGFGTQLDEKAVERLVGVEDLESIDLGDGQVAIVDEMRQGQGETGEWALNDGEPIAGVGVVVSYDSQADEYADATLSLDEARKAVTWGDEDDEGARAEVLSAIVDRLEEMDTAQLKKLLASLDEGDETEGEAAGNRVEAIRPEGRLATKMMG